MTVTALALLFLKTLTVIGAAVYTVFAAVIVRQEQLMAHVLEESFEPVLRFLAIIHFLASLGLLLGTIVLL